MQNVGHRIYSFGAQRKSIPKFPETEQFARRGWFAHAARVQELTKIRTARRGRRARQMKASAAGRRMRPKKFLLSGSEAGEEATAMRKIRRRRPKQAGRRRQRDVLCDVMLSARECETWLTLEELAKLTHYPPASISAQLRHLRKPQFGGFVVRKRQRTSGKILRGEDFGTVWEYQLRRPLRRVVGRKRRRRQRVRMARPVLAPRRGSV